TVSGGGGSSQTFVMFANSATDSDDVRIANNAGNNRIFCATCNSFITSAIGSFTGSPTGWGPFPNVHSGGGAGGSMTIYKSGAVSAGTAPAAGGGGFGQQQNVIGAGSQANDGDIVGRMAGVRVYSRALVLADVAALFAAGG